LSPKMPGIDFHTSQQKSGKEGQENLTTSTWVWRLTWYFW
jgi:hypothetical protein